MSKKMKMWQKLLIAQSGLLLVIGAAGCQPTVIYDPRPVEEIPSMSQTEATKSAVVESDETVVIPGKNGNEVETIEETAIVTETPGNAIPADEAVLPAGKAAEPAAGKNTPAPKSGKIYPAFTMDAPSAVTYTVVKNDSLWKIAIKYGITPEELADYNKLSGSKRLHVGQKLMIPPGGKMLSAADVQKEIARQRRMARKHASNGRTTTSSGRKVAASSKSRSATRPAATASRPADGFHIVQAGDFPAKIAKKYGITVNELLKANNLSSSRNLQIGQRLLIPEISSSASVTKNISSNTPVTVPETGVPAVADSDINSMMAGLDSLVPAGTAASPVAPPAATPAATPAVDIPMAQPTAVPTMTSFKVQEEISVKDFAQKHGLTEVEFCTSNPDYFTEKMIKANTMVMLPSNKQ